jgi:hypothetical protein
LIGSDSRFLSLRPSFDSAVVDRNPGRRGEGQQQRSLE